MIKTPLQRLNEQVAKADLTTGKYILDANGEPVPCTDLLEWARWFETSHEERIIRRDMTPFHIVSTVFLGLDHNWRTGELPVLFETMVFQRVQEITTVFGRRRKTVLGDETDMDRYSTRAEAVAGHERLLAEVRQREADAHAKMKELLSANRKRPLR